MPGMNMADLTNVSLWTSGSRIYAGYRMAVAGQGGSVPPDVAAVVTELQRREQSRFADFIGTLRQMDAPLNEAYMKNRTRDMPVIPAGQSVLDPIYYQNFMLQGTPEIEEEWVWHDMPQELYVANDPNLSDEERAILQDLMPGYTVAANKAAAGEKVYVADPSAIALAKSIRESVLPNASGFGVSKVVSPATIEMAATIGKWVVWGLAILFGGTAIVEWLKGRPAVAEQENRAKELAQIASQNQTKIEMTRRLFDYCVKRLELGGTQLADCNRIREQLGGLEAVAKPPGLPTTGCGFGSCWPWALAGGGLGLLAGHWAAKRWGIQRKE